MTDPIITLTTDFGEDSPYVAVMKGVILSLCPAARIIDLSHAIPPQDVRHAAFFLAECVPFFPVGSIHLAVVDPGVGTQRRLLYFNAQGRQLLAPDNGLATLLARQGTETVRQLSEPRFWRSPVSATFHGRDILAPAAAHLAGGTPPEELGPEVSDWLRLDFPEPREDADSVCGEVRFVDRFGNLLTNLRGDELDPGAADLAVDCGTRCRPRWVRTYGDARPGELVALISSGGWLEIAVVNGSAALHLQAGVGFPVRVRRRNPFCPPARQDQSRALLPAAAPRS